jgi:hypothetical protein
MSDYVCPFCKAPIAEERQGGNDCPHCHQRIRVELMQPADADRSGRGAADWARWGPIRAGLTLMIWGSVLLLLLQFGAYLGLQLVPTLGGPQLGKGECAAPCVLVGAACGGLLTLIGVILCCAGPKEAGTRGWAVLLLLTLTAAAGIVAVWAAVGMEWSVGTFLLLALLLISVSLGALWVVQILRALANSQAEADLGASFLNWYFVQTIVSCFQVVAGFLLVSWRQSPPVLGALCAGGGEVVSLLLAVWWVRLLWRLRDAILFRPTPNGSDPERRPSLHTDRLP